MVTGPTPPLTGTTRILGLAVGLVLFMGVIPILSDIAGFRFLPSGEWVDASRPWALALGAVAGMAGTVLAFVGQRRSAKPWGLLKLVLILPFGAFLFGYVGFDLIVRGVPWAGAVVAGEVVALPYVVEDSTGFGDRRCRDPIELVGLPLLSNSVCGVPEGTRTSFQVGDGIMVVGRGTRLGVFPASVRPG